MTSTKGQGLRLAGVYAGYHGVDVLHGIDLEVGPGEVVALIGANGAGKSTLLNCVSGLVRPRTGRITFGDARIDHSDPAETARLGIAQVPEGRRVFGGRTVSDNLVLGAWVRRRDKDGVSVDHDGVYERFPVLARRRNALAGSLSGGEAQMLAIGMALMSRPRMLLLDEPSLGLAPVVTEEVFAHLVQLRDEGLTILIVEQMVDKALEIAARGYVLSLGSIMLSGTAAELAADPSVQQAYLGA